MVFAIRWIVRFEGRLTQGPNAGKSYTYANSWGGVQFDSEGAARENLAFYRQREPQLAYKLLARQWQGDARKGGWAETELPL